MTQAQWRTVTLVLAVVFLVLVALLVVVVLGRTGGTGSSTATPTSGVSASPSEDASPSAASLEPTSSASSAPPSTAASPTTATVPSARALVMGLGVDDPDSPQAKPRVVVFTSEGGGDVKAKLQATSGGKVELCIYPGTLAKPLGDAACLRSVGGTLTGHAKGKKPFTWTVTLTGVKGGKTPAADVRIDWPTGAPRLELFDVRLQGKGTDPYNGARIDLAGRRAAGAITFQATWSDTIGGDSHRYAAAIADRDSGDILDSADGTGSRVSLGAALAAKQRVAVTLRNPGPSVATEVLATLTLTWP